MSPRSRRTAFGVAIAAFLGAVAVFRFAAPDGAAITMLTAFQRRLLYFPAREFVATPAEHGLVHEDVRLRADDGVILHAWWIPADHARATALFLHGNAGNVSYWADVATDFRAVGWNTLLLDYRGYGRSQGEPSEEGTYLDALAAWKYLITERAIAPSRIVVIGRSLGGGVATWLVGQQRVGGLVLEATFTSIADIVAESLPLPGIRNFVRIGYPNLARISHLSVPLLVVHGRADEIVPFAHGRALFDAAPEPKRFVELRGGHNDAFTLDRGTYVEALREFAQDLERR